MARHPVTGTRGHRLHLWVLAVVALALLAGLFVADRVATTADDARLESALDADADRVAALPPSDDLTSWLTAAVAGRENGSPVQQVALAHGTVVAASSGIDPTLVADPAFVALADQETPVRTLVTLETATARHRLLILPVGTPPETGRYVAMIPLAPTETARKERLVDWATTGLIIFAGTVGLTRLVALWRTRNPRPRRAAHRRTDSSGGPLGVVVTEGFLSRLAFGLLSFCLPLYAHRMGLGLAEIGLLLSTNTAVAILLKPLMGRLIDRTGVRSAYTIAVLLRTLVVLSLMVATTPLHLFWARGLHGVSIALRDPSSSTVLAALGGKKAVAQRFAWYQTAKTVAGSAGQVVAGVLLTSLGGDFGAVFCIAAVLSGVPLIPVLLGLRGPQVRGLVLPRSEGRTPLPPALKQALAPYALLGATMSGTAYLMANLLPVMAVEYMGLPPAAASSIYAMTAVVALSGPLWGWAADRISLKLVLGVRAVGNVISSVIWLLLPSQFGLTTGKMTDDVGKAAFRPAWGSVMARVAALDPSRRTQTLALLSTAEDVGELGAPALAGLIWTVWGLPALLIVRAVAGLATELYAWRLGARGLIEGRDGDRTVPGRAGHPETGAQCPGPRPHDPAHSAGGAGRSGKTGGVGAMPPPR